MAWLQELVKKYSEFISFPIYLWASKDVNVEVPIEDTTDIDGKADGDIEFEDEGTSGNLFVIALLEVLRFSCIHEEPAHHGLVSYFGILMETHSF